MEDDEEINLSEDEHKVRQHINNQTKKEKPCRTRFDVLATPHKRAILGTYQDHAHHFPKDRVVKIKHKLQELFAMTAEETEKYFEQMRSEANKIAKKKMMKVMLRQMYRRRQRQEQERKAYRFVRGLLKRGMRHAFSNPVPLLISVRLRNLSDIILEQICDLRNVNIPNRDNPDQCGMFLMAVADWIAIAIEHVYYGVQLKKNEELEEIEKQPAASEVAKRDGGKEEDSKEKEKEKDSKERKKSDTEKDEAPEKKKDLDEMQDEYDELLAPDIE